MLILYLTWVFPFSDSSLVESKATVRATHESTVISCLGGFLLTVSAKWIHWMHVLIQRSHRSFNTYPQVFWALIPIYYLSVLALSVSLGWNGRHKTFSWHLLSQPAYHLFIFIHLYILSGRAVGPQNPKSLYTNCRNTSDAWDQSEMIRAKPAALKTKGEHQASNCCCLARALGDLKLA